MPQFDSGAAEQIGRFSEGLLLRLLHNRLSVEFCAISWRRFRYQMDFQLFVVAAAIGVMIAGRTEFDRSDSQEGMTMTPAERRNFIERMFNKLKDLAPNRPPLRQDGEYVLIPYSDSFSKTLKAFYLQSLIQP
jgi:hypothetical protein